MHTCFADLHIHIGRTEQGDQVKISGSRHLTFYNIAYEASERKGIEMIGIIDCHSPKVQEDIMRLLDSGQMSEDQRGGIHFQQTTIILGSEIEVRDEGLGAAHLLAYFPHLETIQEFSRWMSQHMRNVNLSSQRIYVPARELQAEVVGRGGLLIPAHIFTPYKSVYGSCSTRMEHLLDMQHIAAVELGLSADTYMASCLSELDGISYLSNSDAHSLGKIGREYNKLLVESQNFEELKLALQQSAGRKVAANYGLNPYLGKYHRTVCARCNTMLAEGLRDDASCPHCGSQRLVQGVADRIQRIADRAAQAQPERPPYHFQVPLEFLPGLGPRILQRLLDQFGTEMQILHAVPYEALESVAGEQLARLIISAREGTLQIHAGGGGKYGSVGAQD